MSTYQNSTTPRGPLWAEHLKLLADRGIARSVAIEHGLVSVDLKEEKRLKESYPGKRERFPYLPLHETTGIAIPYPTTPKDGIPRVRVRADRTEFVRHQFDGQDLPDDPLVKIPRYICQARPATVAPYIPTAVSHIAGDIAKPIYIVEAPLKALALISNGLPAIGLGGVLAGAHDSALLEEYGEIAAHELLRRIDWRNRQAFVVFDASIARNHMVALGAAFLALALQKEGARVSLTTIPYYHVQDSDPSGGRFHFAEDQGPDDYIVRNGIEAFRTRVEQSVLACPVARATEIVQRFRNTDTTNALTAMLSELTVRAMLERDVTLRDRLSAITKKHGVTSQTIKRAYGEFAQGLKKRLSTVDSASDKRPVVYVTSNESAVNDEIIAALCGDNGLFQRGSSLVSIVAEPTAPNGRFAGLARAEGSLKINVLSTPSLRERITQNVALMRKADGGDIPVHPESWMASAIAARGAWAGIRPLVGIIHAPTLRADGTILQTPGYDTRTGLFYIPNDAFPSIPGDPTPEEASAALEVISEPLSEYEFESDMHRAAAIAAIMTPLVRTAILGPVPATIVDAPKRGTGKTMFVDVTSTIATGHHAARFAYSDDATEVKKALLAIVVGGDQFLLVDNVPGRFGGHVWDAFLTAYPTWKDRILGSTATYEGPNNACVFVTGNNVLPHGDVARRSLHVRLTTSHERPDTRNDFRVKDLVARVREMRVKYVVAGLTVVRAFITAGRPAVTTTTWGTFERWHDMIAKPLIWLGLPDPSETRTAFEDQAGSPTSQTASLLCAWHRVFESEPQQAGAILRRIEAERKSAEPDEDVLTLGDAIVAVCGAKGNDLPNSRSFGKRLSSLKSCVERGLRLSPAGERDGSALWRVEPVAGIYTSVASAPIVADAQQPEALLTGAAESHLSLDDV